MSTTTKARGRAAQTDDEDELPINSHPVQPDQVKAGDIHQLSYYVKVTANKGGRQIDTLNLYENNDPVTFNGRALIERSFSADQYHETREVSQTECIDVLLSAGQHPFTVEYTKDNGEYRKLRGVYISFDKRGRSYVIDLDLARDEKQFSEKGRDSRMREVDHRTLSSVILRGIRYVAKQSKKKK